MNIELLKRAALSAGVILERRTEPSRVADLIRRLRPVHCGRNLIRIGGEADGGYLVPDDLEGIEYCFSPGVSSVADFEIHLARLNIRSFLADYSVERPPIDLPAFTFDKKFLGSSDSDTFFTLSSWKHKYLPGYERDLLMQIDIEGAEYEVIMSTPDELLKQFRIIAFEFHYLDRLFDRFAFERLFKPSFDKLLQHFEVVHLHPNNCCGATKADGIEIPRIMEMTLYNKSRISQATPRHDFPHPLDRDNVTANKPLPLPAAWFASW